MNRPTSFCLAFAVLAPCLAAIPALAQNAQACNTTGKNCVVRCNVEHQGKDAASKLALHDCRTQCESERAMCNREAQAAARVEVDAKRRQQQAENEEKRRAQKAEQDAIRAERKEEASERAEEARHDKARRQEQSRQDIEQAKQDQAEARRIAALSVEDRCEAFIQWSKRLEQEYPETNFQRESINKLQAWSYNLFADDHFVPFFGKAYDAMSSGERESVHASTINPCRISDKYRGGFWQWNTLAQPFNKLPHTQFGSATVLSAVAQGREVRAKLAQLKQEAEALPATVQGYDRLAVIGSEANALMTPPKVVRTNIAPVSPLFPSEQAAIRADISSHKMRLAEGALGEKLQPVLMAAPAYDGAVALKRAMQVQHLLVKEVSPVIRKGYENKIEERLSVVITHLLREEKQKIVQFGNNLAGLRDGAAWYLQFEKRYVGEFKDASAPAIQRSYLERRRAQLAAVAPELAGMVRKATSVRDVDQIIAGALPLPSDRDDAATKPVLAAVDTRKVRFCDEGGAHPDDPEAVAAGIADDKINGAMLVAACEGAVKADGKTPRLRFQLARAYLNLERVEDAVESLIQAAQEAHGGALAYLADLHMGGAPGIDADPVLARTLYEKAVASGFEPARKPLSEFEDLTEAMAEVEKDEAASAAMTGPLKPFAMPGIVYGIDSRKFDEIISNETWVKDYLYNIADNIRNVCESHFTERDVDILKAEVEADHFRVGNESGRAAVTATAAMFAELLKNPGAYLTQQLRAASSPTNEDPFDVAMRDTDALFQRYMCKTPELTQFSKNLKDYVTNVEAPLPRSGQIFDACLSNPPPSKYGAREFCACFTGGLANVRVSQKHRKGLVTAFRETSIEIMDIDRNQSQFRVCRSGV
jgi:hypothetical protein